MSEVKGGLFGEKATFMGEDFPASPFCQNAYFFQVGPIAAAYPVLHDDEGKQLYRVGVVWDRTAEETANPTKQFHEIIELLYHEIQKEKSK